MSVFDYDDYKRFVNDWVGGRPKRGHGEYRRIAATLRTSSTVVSQVFRGDRELTLEQTGDLASHLGLTDFESEFLLQLVLLSRAGNEPLRRLVRRRIEELRKQSRELKARIPHEASLSEASRATFYSHWYFSGIRNLVAVPGNETADAIARRLGLPRALVIQVLEFLLQQGLCVEKNGKLAVGPKRTHLEASSLFTARHHVNWRLRAFERYSELGAEELAYTSPMSLSRETAGEIRKELLSVVQRVNQKMRDSPSEEVYCLNLDWFRYSS